MELAVWCGPELSSFHQAMPLGVRHNIYRHRPACGRMPAEGIGVGVLKWFRPF